MTILHLDVLVEEPSAESALRVLLPKIVPDVGFDIQVYEGRRNLLKKLPQRLVGYSKMVRNAPLGLVVLVDRDNDKCLELKMKLENFADAAGLTTPSAARPGLPATMINRIACEELESWFFGDVEATATAFSGVRRSLSDSRYRDPDAIRGGTWEAFERVLQKHGHHSTGLRKVEAAEAVAPHMDVEKNDSASFNAFRDGVRRLVGGER